MKNLILAIITILIGMPVFMCEAAAEKAINPAQTFADAVVQYEAGNYDDAIKEFESILSVGRESGNLYYDLGNSYLKKGNLGMAVLNYERARLFMPRDSDLAANYIFAKSKIKQKDANPLKHWLLISLDTAFSYLTYGEFISLMLYLYYLAFALAIVSIFLENSRRYLAPGIIIIVIFIFIGTGPLYQRIIDMDQLGIVTIPVSDARFEPLNRSAVNFPVYEGMKVRILNTKSGWYKIKRLDGKIGWVTRDSVQPIVFQQPAI